ncbi:MAG: hypothetical protein HYU67_08415 [Flavobacteriia bacterium]|nr:hypothetical protein [Flavobacteriia bacterium]
MTKKRSIISYDKLDIEQKKELLKAFPDGFSSGMTQIKTPTGETLDALLWETEEIIYLVKLNKPQVKAKSVDDEDEDTDDDLDKIEDIEADEGDLEVNDEEEDEYDMPDDDLDEEEEDES